MSRHHHHVERPAVRQVGKLVGRMTAVQHVGVRVRRAFGELLQVTELADIAWMATSGVGPLFGAATWTNHNGTPNVADHSAAKGTALGN